MKSALEPSTQEVLAGLVERLTFHNGSGLNGPIRERLIRKRKRAFAAKAWLRRISGQRRILALNVKRSSISFVAIA
jgi:hypothetical protein